MGHKQFYRRRKPNADCFVNEEFKDPMPEFEPCTCTEADFECDFNFVRSEDGKECIPAASLKVPSGQCKKDDDKYMGPSGYRLIPGNTCDRKGGRELDKEVERSCKETTGRPSNTDIKATKQFFSTDRLPNYFYLERGASSSGRDETIVMHTDQEEVWITHDHGQTWERLLEERDIVRVVPHRYFNDVVYFLTGTEVGYWTTDRGQTVHKFKSPVPFTHEKRLLPMSFHPKHQDWVLWTGAADDCAGGSVCSNAYWSTNRGADWKLLNRYVKRCEFKSGEQGITPDTLVFCEQYENENPATGHLQLLSSTDWFGEKKVHFENILDFAT
ncbi:vacuolar protein sorting/targeting protein PEP1, partial [Ascosphaera atra]